MSNAPLPDLILASASPRRRDLLASLNLQFEVIPPTVEEKTIPTEGLSPSQKVQLLAMKKGESIAPHFPHHLVIASDTIVVLKDQVLEKPVDAQDAFEMLTQLQGQQHQVLSAIAVFHQHECQVGVAQTQVKMRPLSENAIWQYIETKEPLDKAGSYAIQGYGSLLIEEIEGCYFNVVGMSLVLLDQLIEALGFSLWQHTLQPLPLLLGQEQMSVKSVDGTYKEEDANHPGGKLV